MPTPYATEQFTNAQKAQIDGLLTLANTAFAGIERLAALNLNTARSLFEDSAGSARALLAAKTFEEFVAVQGSLAQPAVDKAVLWSRNVYEIGSATHEELSKALESQFAEANQALDSTLDEWVKQAPAGADAAAVLKSALGAAGAAYATLNKTTRQAGEYAAANFAPPAKPATKTKKP